MQERLTEQEVKMINLAAEEVAGDGLNRNWIDSTHDWLYGKSQGTVVWLDTSLLDEENQEVVPTPPSRFRIGIFAQTDLSPDGKIAFKPVADFDTDVDLPNLESRLKLFITTRDPTALPGEDAFESDNSLRVGASRSMFENWKTTVGIKTKWPPELFSYVEWAPHYKLNDVWDFNPKTRAFWENEDGFGALGSLMLGRWNKRFLFRQSASVKWSQSFNDEDEERAADPENVQFGQDGGGYRWDSTTIFGYVTHLLNERDYGRQVGAKDIASGVGLKARISGNEVETLKAQLTLLSKGPLYKDYLYWIIAPEVIWDDEVNWNEEWVLKVGFEMLLWGDDTLR